MNYTNTSFENESFTAITGIESICYAEPKMAFSKEAKRLLKPNGKLAIADNLQGKDELTKKYKGRFVVIVGDAIVGDYPSRQEAIQDALKYRRFGEFLVQEVSENEEIHRFNSRNSM